jgi:hypothetical protein
MKSNKINKAMEERIQKLIDVYCTFVFGVDRDAGWHAPSQLESLQSASMAKKSGGKTKILTACFSSSAEHQSNDKADEKMINEISYVRNKHYDFRLAQMLFNKLEDKQLLALLAGRYLKYVYKREHTNKEIADYLEIEVRAYRHNRTRAEMIIEQHLDFIEQHEQIKSA